MRQAAALHCPNGVVDSGRCGRLLLSRNSVYTSAGPYLSLKPLVALLDFGVFEKSPVE